MVWEGRSREAPPYPDLWHFGDIARSQIDFRFRWKSGRAGAVATPALKRTEGPFLGDSSTTADFLAPTAKSRRSVVDRSAPIPFSSCPFLSARPLFR